jgi:hypothetical protein
MGRSPRRAAPGSRVPVAKSVRSACFMDVALAVQFVNVKTNPAISSNAPGVGLSFCRVIIMSA